MIKMVNLEFIQVKTKYYYQKSNNSIKLSREYCRIQQQVIISIMNTINEIVFILLFHCIRDDMYFNYMLNSQNNQ